MIMSPEYDPQYLLERSHQAHNLLVGWLPLELVKSGRILFKMFYSCNGCQWCFHQVLALWCEDIRNQEIFVLKKYIQYLENVLSL